MNEIVPWFLLAALTLAWYLSLDDPVAGAAALPPTALALTEDVPDWQAFSWADLQDRHAASGRPYLPFLDVPTLSTGLYALPAGGTDEQQPHRRDEVYHILRGRATLAVAGNEVAVQPGSTLFVKAGVAHRFHSIEEDLQVLVVFAAEPQTAP